MKTELKCNRLIMLFPNEEEDDEEKSGMERDGNRSEFSFPCASPAQTAMY